MTQKPSHLFTNIFCLNRCCVTVAKRLEILKVNTITSRLFLQIEKNNKKTSDYASIVSKENVDFDRYHDKKVGTALKLVYLAHLQRKPFVNSRNSHRWEMPRYTRTVIAGFYLFSICKKQSRGNCIYFQRFPVVCRQLRDSDLLFTFSWRNVEVFEV